MSVDHMPFIETVVAADVKTLQEKERTYKGSWKRRGGVGAAMMVLRKFDRLESMLQSEDINYDIFAAIEGDPSGADGSPLAEIRDARCYLTLIEAEMMARGAVKPGIETLRGIVAPHYASGGVQVFPLDPLGDGSYRGPDDSIIVVPLEDSNKHADRPPNPLQYMIGNDTYTYLPKDVQAVYVRHNNSVWVMSEFVQDMVFHQSYQQTPRITQQLLDSYVGVTDEDKLTNGWIINRRNVRTKLPPLPDHVGTSTLREMPWQYATLYEQTAPDGGWRIKEEYRAWTR